MMNAHKGSATNILSRGIATDKAPFSSRKMLISILFFHENNVFVE